MIFADYTRRVTEEYLQKKVAGRLSFELTEPTPGRLRDISLIAYTERYDRRDERILEKFFGKTDEKKTRYQTIERFDLDRLKPLANYLKTSTGTTDPKNIELLAWLIDYKGRPYDFEKKDDAPAKPVPNTHDEPNEIKTDLIITTEKQTHPNQKKLIIVFTVTIVFAGVGLYLTLGEKRFFQGSQACMFWSGDHYQPVPCNKAPENTLTIPLDSKKIAVFRKITRPDTITENALGSVWYVKYRNAYECYTSSGNQPVDTTLKLKPLSDYVLIKYIHPGLQPTAVLP